MTARMAVQFTGLIAGYYNGLDPVLPGSRVLRMGWIQYFQDPGILKWLEIQYFQNPGSLKWLEIQYFQDPES